MIPVREIQPNPHQPRQAFDPVALERLAESIKRSGMMQPVIVRPATGGAGAYKLIAGERRWRAAKMAGLIEVPAVVRNLSDEECAEWALVENVQREDLNAMEKAWAFRALAERFGLTHAQIADRVGLDRSSVANLIRLNDLEEAIKQLIASGRLNAGHGKALLAAPAGAGRAQLAEQAADESWTVRRLERAAVALLAGMSDSTRSSGTVGLSPARAARLDLEKQLSEHLGTKVTIVTDRGGQRGKMTIEFYGLDHFDGLVARMGFRAR
jgi:ParB family chromosome partitioning protein